MYIGIYGFDKFKLPVIPVGKVQTKLVAFKVPVAFNWTVLFPQVTASKPALAIGLLSIIITTSCV